MSLGWPRACWSEEEEAEHTGDGGKQYGQSGKGGWRNKLGGKGLEEVRAERERGMEEWVGWERVGRRVGKGRMVGRKRIALPGISSRKIVIVV